jgi:hypothetical protein
MLSPLLAFIQITTYFVSLTLAGYVLSRGRFQALPILTAGILICYAIIQTDQFLGANFAGQTDLIGRVFWLAYPLPVALWVRMAILLRPGAELDQTLDRLWWSLVLPVAMVLVIGGMIGNDLFIFASYEPGPLYWVFPLYNIVLMSIGLGLHYHNYQRLSHQDSMRKIFMVLVLASIGYLVSMMVLLADLLPAPWLFVLLASDYILLGLAGIAYDAFSEGQRIQQDLGMTFIKGALVTGVVVMPWTVALMLSNVQTLSLGIALFFSQGVIAIGISLQDDIEGWLEQLILRRRNRQREDLRTLLLNSVRQPDPISINTIENPDEFIRLTRRALSHLPNLPRLAASPLTDMPLVLARVEPNANSLQRAQELRQLLRECIETLRPQSETRYGIGEEWRFYNALYYPYVAGLSPYKRTPPSETLTDELKVVLRWFQQEVPPRTLYNWQNRGAEMIAGILLEQEKNVN